MGHFDSSYASIKYYALTEKEKTPFYLRFQEELNRGVRVWGSLDSLTGWILRDWARVNNYSIEYHKDGIFVKRRD